MSRRLTVRKNDNSFVHVVIQDDDKTAFNDLVKTIGEENKYIIEHTWTGQRKRYGDTTREFFIYTNMTKDEVRNWVNEKYHCGTDWWSPHITTLSEVENGYKVIVTEAWTD